MVNHEFLDELEEAVYSVLENLDFGLSYFIGSHEESNPYSDERYSIVEVNFDVEGFEADVPLGGWQQAVDYAIHKGVIEKYGGTFTWNANILIISIKKDHKTMNDLIDDLNAIFEDITVKSETSNTCIQEMKRCLDQISFRLFSAIKQQKFSNESKCFKDCTVFKLLTKIIENKIIGTILQEVEAAIGSLPYELPYELLTCPEVEINTEDKCAIIAFLFNPQFFGKDVPETWKKDVEERTENVSTILEGHFLWKDSMMIFTIKRT